ncbi:MAG: hypothetical protein ACE1ZA_05135 [Pseudomonadales bacterium]
MKRYLLRITFFLIFGAVVNIAVAWGCALSVDTILGTRVIAHEGSIASEVGYARWIVERDSRRGGTRFDSRRSHFDYPTRDTPVHPIDLLPKWSNFGDPVAGYESGLITVHRRIGDARGWPMLSMWSEPYIAYKSRDEGWVVNRGNGGIKTPLPAWHRGTFPPERYLPLRIIWFGFAINTMLYSATAASLWILVCTPFLIRRAVRRKRNQCPHCGYPIGVSAACTECGRPIQTRLRPGE